MKSFVRDANLPGVLPDVGEVCGQEGEGDEVGGKVGLVQAQGGGTLRSFSPDPENENLSKLLKSKILVFSAVVT